MKVFYFRPSFPHLVSNRNIVREQAGEKMERPNEYAEMCGAVRDWGGVCAGSGAVGSRAIREFGRVIQSRHRSGVGFQSGRFSARGTFAVYESRIQIGRAHV